MKNTATIIFSKNRSMQADLCLSTLFLRCKDILELSNISVLYICDPEHVESYEILKKDYPQVNFVEEKLFKNDLLLLIHDNTSILFPITDDTIFTENFSLRKIIDALDGNRDTLGFSLRLGNNTNWCFPLNIPQGIPAFDIIDSENKINKYNWTLAEHDFSYPLEISSSVYRLEDIFDILEKGEYINPNTLEAILAQNAPRFVNEQQFLLCYKKSVAFSCPLNRVQTYNQNRCGNINADRLKDDYMNNYRIDPNYYYKYPNASSHELTGIPFIKKEKDE
jgi:hypothetical protein